MPQQMKDEMEKFDQAVDQAGAEDEQMIMEFLQLLKPLYRQTLLTQSYLLALMIFRMIVGLLC